jgi:hypothetical protein
MRFIKQHQLALLTCAVGVSTPGHASQKKLSDDPAVGDSIGVMLAKKAAAKRQCKRR